jgi:hypothetical protein
MLRRSSRSQRQIRLYELGNGSSKPRPRGLRRGVTMKKQNVKVGGKSTVKLRRFKVIEPPLLPAPKLTQAEELGRELALERWARRHL